MKQITLDRDQIEKNWETIARVENGSFNIPFERKVEFEECSTKIDYRDLSLKQKDAILELNTRVVDSRTSAFDNIFPATDIYNEYCYLVSHKNRIYLVNNEGFQYCRYIIELINY